MAGCATKAASIQSGRTSSTGWPDAAFSRAAFKALLRMELGMPGSGLPAASGWRQLVATSARALITRSDAEVARPGATHYCPVNEQSDVTNE